MEEILKKKRFRRLRTFYKIKKRAEQLSPARLYYERNLHFSLLAIRLRIISYARSWTARHCCRNFRIVVSEEGVTHSCRSHWRNSSSSGKKSGKRSVVSRMISPSCWTSLPADIKRSFRTTIDLFLACLSSPSEIRPDLKIRLRSWKVYC